MQATSEWKWKHAYALEEDHIKKLWTLLEDRIGEVEAELHCAHDTKLKVKELKQLLGYANSSERQIISMSLRAWKKADTSAWLVFPPSNDYTSGIRVELNASEDVVQRLKDRIREVLVSSRPWYSRIARNDYISHALNIFLVVSCLFTFLSTSGLVGADAQILRPYFWIVVFPVVGLLGGWVLNVLSRRVFPMASFCIGEGKKRYGVMENVRWVVVIGFTVGIAASAVVGLLL